MRDSGDSFFDWLRKVLRLPENVRAPWWTRWMGPSMWREVSFPCPECAMPLRRSLMMDLGHCIYCRVTFTRQELMTMARSTTGSTDE